MKLWKICLESIYWNWNVLITKTKIDMKLVTIKTYTEILEANVHLALLENNGIEAIIDHDQDVLVNPGMMTSAGIELKVLEEEAEKALEIIENQMAIE